MSLLIKGIDMPKLHKTYKVQFAEENDRIIIGVAIGDSSAYRPLGEVIIVPTPHGRLIDADAFEARARAVYCDDCDRRKGKKNGKVRMVYGIGDVPCRACETDDMLCDIEAAPTIIDAEGKND